METRPEIIALDESMMPALQQLAAEIWWAHYPGLISDEQIRFMLARMYSPVQLSRELKDGVRYFGLQDPQALCGYFSVRRGSEADAGALPDTGADAWLDKLYLRPACHGRGWGQLMLHAAAECAWALGATRLCLRVNRYNEGAIAAYRRAGFVLLGEDCKDIGDGFVMDDFIFGLSRR